MTTVVRSTSKSCRHSQMRGRTCRSGLLVGIVALITVKTADIVTTVVGLSRISEAVEANPIPATMIAEFGLVPGLVLTMVVSIILVTVITEWLSGHASGPADRGGTRRSMRLLGFGSATFVSLLPVVSNTLLLLDHGVLF